MSASTQTIGFFDTLARVLIRCAGLGFLLLLIWFTFYMFLGDVVYQLHGEMLGLSKETLDAIHYCGMGLLKLFIFIFFLFPWLGIRWIMRKG